MKANSSKPPSRPSPSSASSSKGQTPKSVKGATPKRTPRNAKSKDSPSVIIEDKFGGLSLQSQKKRPDSTGLAYDDRMLSYCSLRDENYPECPARISEPFKRCENLGLVKRCHRMKVTPATDDSLIEARHDKEYISHIASSTAATREELETLEHSYHNVIMHNKTPSPVGDSLRTGLHSEKYVCKIKSYSSMTRDQLIEAEHEFDGVAVHQNVMECARLAAKATVDIVEAVVTDKISNGLAIIRPPGHHAQKSEACGYCYFNNVALAAHHCITKLNQNRVLIVDWDVHHGNGTQEMFYDDPRVLYISIHRYEHGWFWPNLREGNFDAVGEGRGAGFNINIPLNKTGMTDGDYLAIFHQLILPVALEFNPDTVIVSAGYDCAIGCPEGEMLVTPAAFGHFVHKLKSLAEGRLSVILEGGYCIHSLSESVAYTLRALLDDPCAKLRLSQPPQPELVSTLLNSINVLRQYWKCFTYQNKDYPDKSIDLSSSDPRGEPKYSTEENKPAYHEFDDLYPVQTEEVKEEFSKKINELVKSHSIRVTKHRSCYVYDVVMLKHKSVLDPTHPERPERISRIHDMLNEYGLLDRCLKLATRKATNQELCLVHSMKHVNEMKAIASMKPRDFKEKEEEYNSIYLHQSTNEASLVAAGSLLNIVDSVMTNESRNGFAITRPPGHHAEKNKPYGFCFFNNVPIAAKYAQQKHKANRIAIIDWDVHHGNGTQHMFEEDDSVLYISLHRYDDGWFFPGSQEANYDVVGKEKGTGYNVNIPFNSQFKKEVKCRAPGDPEYIAAFQQIVMPICYEFAPDLVFISAGFDAAKGDPLGGYRITPGGYAYMTHMLSSLANGRLILVLEGGYNLNSISESFSSCVNVMLGGSPPRLKDVIPDWAAVESIQNVIRVHKKYWKSLCCDSKYRTRLEPPPPQPTLTQIPQDISTLPYNELEIAQIEYDKALSDDKDQELIKTLTEKLKKIKLGVSSPPKPTSSSAISDRSRSNVGASAESGVVTASVEGAVGGAEAASPDVDDVHQMFAVIPIKWCAHLEDNQPLPYELDVKSPCRDCGNIGENWVCLTCYKVYCSRYVNEHMLYHSISTDHRMVLSYADLSVWCYACDAYVHNVELLSMKNSAHKSKFGCDQPDWAMYDAE